MNRVQNVYGIGKINHGLMRSSRKPLQKPCCHSRHFSGQGQSRQLWRIKPRWVILPTVGLTSYYVYREIFVVNTVANEYEVEAYRMLPLNVLSRLWGKLNGVELPVWMRKPVLKLYIKLFNVNLDEAAVRDLQYYRNLGEFFRRAISPTCRPISKSGPLVSPSDGKILHFGRVEDGRLEQVKGVTYSLPGFIGPNNWPSQENGYTYKLVSQGTNTEQPSIAEKSYEKSLLHPDKALYHCIIYLAPGDYHRFHSPAQWTVSMRRYFPGDLLSVNPRIAKRIQGLFNLNERAVYLGQWEQGFMAMAAVGATNVGSIRVYFDENLKTNEPVNYPEGSFSDEVFARKDRGGISFKKGEPFGEFNLGSTIVLVFEASKHFQFDLEDGQIIKMGQLIGSNTQRNVKEVVVKHSSLQ